MSKIKFRRIITSGEVRKRCTVNNDKWGILKKLCKVSMAKF